MLCRWTSSAPVAPLAFRPVPLLRDQKAYETLGRDGLDPKVRRRPRTPNQTPREIERQILAIMEQHPTYSYLRLAGQLKLVGIGVSAAAVPYVSQRHGLTTPSTRLLRLERRTAKGEPFGPSHHITHREPTAAFPSPRFRYRSWSAPTVFATRPQSHRSTVHST